jgi:hypothetical protein
MDAAKDMANRRKYRREVDKLDDAIAARWKTINEWLASGKLPATTDDDQLPAGSLTLQDVNAYRTYISRGIAEPDKITEEKRATMQERITALIAGGQKFDDTTVEKLMALGFTTE